MTNKNCPYQRKEGANCSAKTQLGYNNDTLCDSTNYLKCNFYSLKESSERQSASRNITYQQSGVL